jgi:quinol monooxygenase YgiN
MTDRDARAREQIRFVIEIEVDDVARFKEIVHRCVEVSRGEPGTLVYDWYLDEENGRARLYEAYENADAVRAHVAGRVFTDVGIPLFEITRFVHMDAFGDLGTLFDELPALWPTTQWGVPFEALAG